MANQPIVSILGVFVADTAYRAARPPAMGETILGNSFALGPGGKGSNQAVAAAMAGAQAHLITRLGEDAFADLAFATWKKAGVLPAVTRDPSSYTGAAYIFIEEATGNNAIIICPGAASRISEADVEAHAKIIAASKIFITQLEQPIAAAKRGLEIARRAGVATILNPAPAAPLGIDVVGLCDYLTPNETEAAAISGLPVGTLAQARAAAAKLTEMGAGMAILTLGENGALVHGRGVSQHVAAFRAGPVVETTGAGDAFNGAFATALAEGRDPVAAARFGCAAAGISVTRPGTAASMPSRAEILALMEQSR